MAPLCLFYFSHPFGILSPNPPSVTMAPEDYLPPSWMSSAFSEKSWIPIGFPIKKIDVSSTTERDDTPEYKTNFTKQSTRQNHPEDAEINKKHTKPFQRQKKFETKKIPFEPFKSSKLNIQRPANIGFLPPIEKINKTEKKIEPIQSWPNNENINKFRRKSLLPPIDMRCLLPRKDSASESSRCESKNNREDMSDGPAPRKVKVKRKMRSTKRIRPIRSSRGVNKGRCLPNRSAARKLVACLLQNASKGKPLWANYGPWPAVGRYINNFAIENGRLRINFSITNQSKGPHEESMTTTVRCEVIENSFIAHKIFPFIVRRFDAQTFCAFAIFNIEKILHFMAFFFLIRFTDGQKWHEETLVTINWFPYYYVISWPF